MSQFKRDEKFSVGLGKFKASNFFTNHLGSMTNFKNYLREMLITQNTASLLQIKIKNTLSFGVVISGTGLWLRFGKSSITCQRPCWMYVDGTRYIILSKFKMSNDKMSIVDMKMLNNLSMYKP
jgi:hypothetical protein